MPTYHSVNLDGGVYFLQMKDAFGPIKIGYSADIRHRRFDLLVGMPYELELLGYLPGRTMYHEKKLHERFKAYHMRGEWFSPGPRLIDYINARCVKGENLTANSRRAQRVETYVPPF